MAKKKAPEVSVTEGAIIEHAIAWQKCRALKAKIDAREKVAQEGIITEASTLRDSKLENREIIGIVRAVPEEQTPVITNFQCKSKESGITLEDAEAVRPLFNGAFDELFQEDTVVTGVDKPEQLIDAMREDGRQPFDFLELVPKKGMDHIVAEYGEYVSADTAYVPVEGFLATLNDFIRSIPDEALEAVLNKDGDTKENLFQYIQRVFRPVVKSSSTR